MLYFISALINSFRAVKICNPMSDNLQIIDRTLDLVKQSEKPQDSPPKQQERSHLGLPIYETKTNI